MWCWYILCASDGTSTATRGVNYYHSACLKFRHFLYCIFFSLLSFLNEKDEKNSSLYNVHNIKSFICLFSCFINRETLQGNLLWKADGTFVCGLSFWNIRNTFCTLYTFHSKSMSMMSSIIVFFVQNCIHFLFRKNLTHRHHHLTTWCSLSFNEFPENVI